MLSEAKGSGLRIYGLGFVGFRPPVQISVIATSPFPSPHQGLYLKQSSRVFNLQNEGRGT